MIRDGKLAYGATPSPLQDFEFESVVLKTFIIALFATILSHQAASLALDLFLGIKSPNQARVSDIHILLLTRESSPLAVCASVLRLDWLTRKEFRGDLQEGTNIERDANRVRALVVWKFLSLLALVPFLNICSIVLSFGRERTITFEEAQFGGTSLGVNPDLSVLKVEPFKRSCQFALFEQARSDSVNVTFYLCQRFTMANRALNESSERVATIQLLREQLISGAVLVVTVGKYGAFSERFAEVFINESFAFRLQSTISPATAETLVNFGIDLLVRKCRLENPILFEIGNYSTGTADLLPGKGIWCPDFAEDEVSLTHRMLGQLTSLITFVEAEVLELQNYEFLADGTFNLSAGYFFRGDDYPFLVRTKPFVSLPMLVIITAVVFLVRVVLKLFLNNDVAEGVLRLVKKGLGLHYWESLLRSAQVEQYYGNNGQNGEERTTHVQTAREVIQVDEPKCIENGLTGS